MSPPAGDRNASGADPWYYPHRLSPLSARMDAAGVLAQWCRAPHAWSGCDAAGTTARYRRARRPMQVQCSKCSELLALSDAIESPGGRLSHMDCKRPGMVTMEESALLFAYCYGHAVAYCLGATCISGWRN